MLILGNRRLSSIYVVTPSITLGTLETMTTNKVVVVFNGKVALLIPLAIMGSTMLIDDGGGGSTVVASSKNN